MIQPPPLPLTDYSIRQKKKRQTLCMNLMRICPDSDIFRFILRVCLFFNKESMFATRQKFLSIPKRTHYVRVCEKPKTSGER